MAEKMLVTQALDERDLLVKKIQDKIAKASFTDVKKHNEKKVIDRRVVEETFRQEAESAYQQIMDLIERFQKIDVAIVAYNVATMIHPFCEKCYERGVLVPVEKIHHKLPLAEGGTHDRSNLIALCKSCHSQIHAKRGDRWHDR